MTPPKNHRFTESPAEIDRDLRLARHALKRGLTRRPRNWFTRLADAGMAELRLEFKDNQYQYTLRWLEAGRNLTHTAAARLVDSGGHRRRLILSDFPESITPLVLLTGNFYASPTLDHEVILPGEDAQRLPASDQMDLWPSSEYRLAASSDDDDSPNSTLTLWDSPETPQADDVGTSKADDDTPPEANRNQDTQLACPPELLVDWSGRDRLLKIRFTPASAVGFKETIPIVIEIKSEDSHSPATIEPIYGRLRLKSPASNSWYCELKANRPGYSQGSACPLTVRIKACVPDHVLPLGELKENQRTTQINDYLASINFKSYLGKLESSAASFEGFTDNLVDENDLMIRIVDSEEAEQDDAGPFDPIVPILVDLQPKLIRRARKRLKLLELGSVDVDYAAKDLVSNLFEQVFRDHQYSYRWIRVWNNQDYDEDGPRGGYQGVRRKLFSVLRGRLSNFVRDHNTHRTYLESTYGTASRDETRGNSIFDLPVRQVSSTIARQEIAQRQLNIMDQELVDDYLTERERLVWEHREQSVRKLVLALKTVIPDYTKNKARTDLDSINSKQRVLRTIKRLFSDTGTDASVLSRVEYEILVSFYLRGQTKTVIKKELGLTKDQWLVMKQRVDRVVQATIAAIDLYVGYGSNRKTKEQPSSRNSSKRTSGNAGVIQLWELEFLLDWIVKPTQPVTAADIACATNRSLESIEGDLKRLGLKLHSQIVINQGKLPANSKALLRYWLIDGRDLESAIAKLLDHERHKQQVAAQKKARRAGIDIPAESERPLAIDSEQLLSTICCSWPTVDSPVPVEYQTLPEEPLLQNLAKRLY